MPQFESKHFKLEEFSCKDGCGLCDPDPTLVAALDLFRDMVGKPVMIDAGCRCAAHNASKAVGGVSGSQHILGTAADIRVAGMTTLELYEVARKISPFYLGGIGIYDGDFIHVDVRKGMARWSRVNGKYGKLTDFPGYTTAALGN